MKEDEEEEEGSKSEGRLFEIEEAASVAEGGGLDKRLVCAGSRASSSVFAAFPVRSTRLEYDLEAMASWS